MCYRVTVSDIAVKKLKKLDRSVAALIIGFIEKNLDGCEDPRRHGKALTANHKGKWRYRVGDYRILALIEDEKILITIIDVGHRKDIYD
jgi:mRNA interferase RelE/StbE